MTGLVFLCGGCDCYIETDPDRDHDHEGARPCPRCERTPDHGDATLLARARYDDYEAATISFEQATTVDGEVVLNDWDLLFGNDRDPERDQFDVNTVTDDRSAIVDLGPIALADAPPLVPPPTAQTSSCHGPQGCADVALGHLYLVQTCDSDTRQLAAFRVLEHCLNDSVTIRWYRSADPDRFVPDGWTDAWPR